MYNGLLVVGQWWGWWGWCGRPPEEGAGDGECDWEKTVEKILSASTAFAASEGWKASQNTNSVRFLHSFELGKHSPPRLATLQHEVLDTLNPAPKTKFQLKQLRTKYFYFYNGIKILPYRRRQDCWLDPKHRGKCLQMWVVQLGGVVSERSIDSLLWSWIAAPIYWLALGIRLALI